MGQSKTQPAAFRASIGGLWYVVAMASTALGCTSGGADADVALEQRSFDVGETEPPRSTGVTRGLDELPLIEAEKALDTFVQRLREPTRDGENVALHLRLPPPLDESLQRSLVRIVGDPERPLVLFQSDALARLGRIEKSPGPDFFTTFVQLDERELEERARAEQAFERSEAPSRTQLVFRGRTPVAVTSGVHLDPGAFLGGDLIALGACPITPASTPARWDESLLITTPAVVADPTRTHDACAPGGAPDGVWTFKHLMAEMAIGSGLSTHDFVVRWLSYWLQPYSVNGDLVPARLQMFTQVLQPWANASGVSATLTSTGSLALSGPLDLDRAPFRLSAIVNRLDLGDTVSGPSGYGGGTTTEPLDAGELRFVFGVQDLDTCNVLPFSVIFEYGVPIVGCTDVRKWALEWTRLNDPAFAPPFSAAWLAQLEGMTESVVRNGAAPTKGNQNALNQIRTNEIALDFPWELREFTLAVEDLVLDTTLPVNGPLRPHTVAMTPDDAAYSPTPQPDVDGFVFSSVLPSVPGSVPSLPADCAASFSVPSQIAGVPFRGANALTAPPTHWEASVHPLDNRELCARHQLSLNTCNGCHLGDTSTPFLHVDPRPMPAALSGFLTGGGGVWAVPDTQFGAPLWTFADLERRFQRLYSIACTTCGRSIGIFPGVLDLILELSRVVPIDPIGPISLPFEVGPIEDFAVLERILDARPGFLDTRSLEDVELSGAVRPAQTFVH